jgi:hypothetical protein
VYERFAFQGAGHEKQLDVILGFAYSPNALSIEQTLHGYFDNKRAFGYPDALMPFADNGQSEVYVDDILGMDEEFTREQARGVRARIQAQRTGQSVESIKVDLEQDARVDADVQDIINLRFTWPISWIWRAWCMIEEALFTNGAKRKYEEKVQALILWFQNEERELQRNIGVSSHRRERQLWIAAHQQKLAEQRDRVLRAPFGEKVRMMLEALRTHDLPSFARVVDTDRLIYNLAEAMTENLVLGSDYMQVAHNCDLMDLMDAIAAGNPRDVLLTPVQEGYKALLFHWVKTGELLSEDLLPCADPLFHRTSDGQFHTVSPISTYDFGPSVFLEAFGHEWQWPQQARRSSVGAKRLEEFEVQTRNATSGFSGRLVVRVEAKAPDQPLEVSFPNFYAEYRRAIDQEALAGDERAVVPPAPPSPELKALLREVTGFGRGGDRSPGEHIINRLQSLLREAAQQSNSAHLVVGALLSADPQDAVRSLTGKLNWESITYPWEIVAPVFLCNSVSEANAPAAMRDLLKLALEEFDRGGKAMFVQIKEYDGDDWVLQPLQALIDANDLEAIGLYLEAGLWVDKSVDDEIGPVASAAKLYGRRRFFRAEIFSDELNALADTYCQRHEVAREFSLLSIEGRIPPQRVTDNVKAVADFIFNDWPRGGIQQLVGKIDWPSVINATGIVSKAVNEFDETDVRQGEHVIKGQARLVALLRLALAEQNRGGLRMFELRDERYSMSKRLDPIQQIIHMGFVEALKVYMEAGFDPQRRSYAFYESSNALEYWGRKNADVHYVRQVRFGSSVSNLYLETFECMNAFVATREADETAGRRPRRDIAALDPQDALWRYLVDGQPSDVQELAGRLDWIRIQEPWNLVVEATHFHDRGLAPHQSKDVIWGRLVDLLRLALSERDRAGSHLFELWEDYADHYDYDFDEPESRLEPIRTLIEQRFSKALGLFMDAGFDPYRDCGTSNLSTIDMALKMGNSEMVDFVCAYNRE